MELSPELIKLLSTKSMMRYFPPASTIPSTRTCACSEVQLADFVVFFFGISGPLLKPWFGRDSIRAISVEPCYLRPRRQEIKPYPEARPADSALGEGTSCCG